MLASYLNAVPALHCGCCRVRRAADIESCAVARLIAGCAHLLPATPHTGIYNFPVLRQIDTLCVWKGKGLLDRLTRSIGPSNLIPLFAILCGVLCLLLPLLLGVSRSLANHFISVVKKVALCFFCFCVLFTCFAPECETKERPVLFLRFFSFCFRW